MDQKILTGGRNESSYGIYSSQKNMNAKGIQTTEGGLRLDSDLCLKM